MGKALDQEMYEHFSRLDDTQKKSVIQLLKSFLKGQKTAAGRHSLQDYNQELDDAMARATNGGFTTLEELEKEMRAW
ncbi:hypothetical protein [Chitinophaga sp.]|uniref:hypothetical protein n=1 Tax=Chitinophaga sp. TaxID=1869181 RepID=UPI0031D46843